jgi:hypothetical protein
MINIVLDSIIPGDRELKMPPASTIDFKIYTIKYGIENIVNAFIIELKKISIKKFDGEFNTLDELQKNIVLKEIKFKNIRLFTEFIKHVFRAYYSDKQVLSTLNVGASPPFPKGNTTEEDDWTILMPVYERGKIYRGHGLDKFYE